MKQEIRKRIDDYKELNDIHQYKVILKIATDFILFYEKKSVDDSELELGIEIIRELTTLDYLGSLPQYEHDYDLQKTIRYLKIKVFKVCIPQSCSKLRGITELLIGMKENALG